MCCVLSGKSSFCRSDHSSRGVLPSVMCLECDREISIMGRSWPTGGEGEGEGEGLLHHEEKL